MGINLFAEQGDAKTWNCLLTCREKERLILHLSTHPLLASSYGFTHFGE